MSLGHFGGKAPRMRHTQHGGEGPSGGGTSLLPNPLDQQAPTSNGSPAASGQLRLLDAALSNILRNGSFESWSSGTTAAPDGWTLTGAGATIARNTTNVQDLLASVDVTAALNTATDLAQSVTISSTQNTRLRGRRVTFSVRVKTSTAARVFLKIDDGVNTKNSFYHTGGGAFETLDVTLLLDDSATKVEASIEISSGASITATADSAMLVEGASPSGFIPHRSDDFLIPTRQTSSSNATISAPGDVGNWVDLDSMTISNVILNGNQSVLLLFAADLAHNASGFTVDIQFLRDSTTVGVQVSDHYHVVDRLQPIANVALDRKPAAGVYTYKVQWRADATTLTCSHRVLDLLVVPDL